MNVGLPLKYNLVKAQPDNHGKSHAMFSSF